MGTGRGAWIPLWIPILVIALTHHKVQAQYADQQSQYDDQQSQYDDQQSQYDDYLSMPQTKDTPKISPVTIIPPVRTSLAFKAGNPAHNGQVCSTWGNFHFKTFDGDIYYFPGLCNYVFASHCKAAYEDFNIQIRRSVAQNASIISHVTIKIDGLGIELTPNSITVDGERVQLPYSHSGILIDSSTGYIKITSKLGLLLIWNQEDGLLLELNEKYANQTCGLCGDFNGISTYSEFVKDNIMLNPVQFGNMQKMDGPTEQCQDPDPSSASNCSTEFTTICQTVLTGEAFTGCNAQVAVQDYIDACIQDLCQCEKSMTEFCICNTFAEYSRQCAHAGGQPLEWRTEDLCVKPCPFNMQHRECGSACSDTCTNPERSQLCEEHCTDGCFCPPGTVFDDINNSGCIPLRNCHCTYNGNTYSPGASFASQCTSCTCTGGQWTCVSLSCPGICSIEGGSHISTFDEKQFSFFGDCSYVLTKLCNSNAFTVLGEIRKCGLTDTETCLKGVAISIGGGQTVVVIKSTGVVYVNMILTQLPVSAANVTIFRPSSFFMIVQTNFGLQLEIQLVPIMQLFVRLDPTYKGQTCGLCGNFNSIQTDDFKVISGVVEGTSAAFVNTWKTQADCPNIKNIFENPCTLSIENEKYATHWCGLLTDSNGPFQKCHSEVNPEVYHTNCMFDTCNCERSEDCMCAALSSYVRACAAKGVLLSGWRTSICTKYQICPKTLAYRYNIDSCQSTCRALSEPDVTCNIKFTPVDGCTCEEGTYLDESGKCVPATSCPCYYKGTPLPSGEVVHDNGIICTCTQGKLQCIGEKPPPVCDAPMIYFDCANSTAGVTGAECQKSCQTLDMGCYSTQCVSGCTCPNELVSDGKGGCVAAEECPCIHNEATFEPGETIKVKCNTCTCKNRKWECSNEPCLATCSVYGDGHYITFDGKRYSFSGDCEYTLVQDHCNKNNTNAGFFRVITENIPCGTTGTTCSKTIKVFLKNYELILADGKFEVIQRVPGGEVPYKVRYMGIYMVIDTTVGLVLLWDKKTSIFIKLGPEYEGQVCGLCGNYDGNDMNDFTTRSLSVVGDILEFGNSWKVSPTCPDAKNNKDPCTANPYRSSWAQKQCSIINSQVFALCHSQVEPTKYYDACVSDACACDTGGDCECFCTAVASYAQACNEAGVCVSWRTPSICPLFCDYYNPQGECEWHYKPCGSPCMKTCRNPFANCTHQLQGLEGCYPKCPANKPYFDEDDMECVDHCRLCFDDKGNVYKPGEKIPSEQNCQSCTCTTEGRTVCGYDYNDCYCIYEGKKVKPGDIVYNTTDGIGGCITAICGRNGTIERNIFACQTTAAPSTFSFSTSSPATTTTGPITTSICVQEVCHWSQWYDVSKPGSGNDDGDFDTFDNLRSEGYEVCKAPKAVECRAEKFPNTPLRELGQKVECSKTVGLVCYNKDQHPMSCYNYQIKIQCCSFVPCSYTTASTPETTTTSVAPTTTKPTTTLTSTLTSTSAVPETTTILATTTETTSSSIRTTIISTRETVSPTTRVTTRYTTTSTPETTTVGSTTTSASPTPQAPSTATTTLKTTTTETTTSPVPETTTVSSTASSATSTLSATTPQATSTATTTPKTTTTETTTSPVPETTTVSSTASSATSTLSATTPQATSTATTTPKTTTTETTTSPVPETTTVSSTASSATSTLSATTPQATSTATTTPKTTTTETTTSPVPETTTVGSTTSSATSTLSATTPKATSTATTTLKTTTTETTTSPVPATTVTAIPSTIEHSTTIRPRERTTELTTTTLTTSQITTKGTTTVSTEAITTLTTTQSPTTRTHTPTTVTTSPVTTKASETTTPLTTLLSTSKECTKEVCEWSQWYDISYPGPEPNDGDFDTFNNIRAKGYEVCKVPKNVQCRAERYPDTPLSQLEQKVTCSKTEGLICHNKDQLPPICYNYEIRIECCKKIIVPCPTTRPLTTTKPATTTIKTSTTIENTTPESISTTRVITTTAKTIVTHTGTTTRTPASTAAQVNATTTITTEAPSTTIKITTPTTTQTTKTTRSTTTKETTLVTTPKVTTTPTSTIHTTLPTTTLLKSTTTEQTTTSVGTTCAPICKWSKWFDVDVPTSEPNGGDLETYNNIRAVGEKICGTPSNIQCRARDHPELTIEQVGQIVECDVNYGLVCKNKDQTGNIKKCLNYEIRVLCCEKNSNCLTTPIQTSATSKSTTTVTPPTTTMSITTTTPRKTTVPQTTTTETTATTTRHSTKETTPVTTTKATPTPTRQISTSLPTTTQLPSTTTEQTPTSVGTKCAPVCKWSTWFDVDFPTSGPNGGDRETYNNIQAAGGKICKKPVNIQCRAEDHPELTIEQVGQIVKCDINFGLVCNNEDQTGKFKLCYNYEIRVRCCEENTNCLTTTSHTTTTSQPTTTVTPPTTTVHTTTTRPVTTTLPETTTTETTATTASTTTKGTIPVTTTKVVTSPTPHVTTSLPTTTQLPSTTTQQTTTSVGTTCAPICKWSEWFDVDFPTSGPNGGDRETYNNIQAAGGKVCSKPVNIQCRAENHPELTTDQVGQIVKCDINFGLVCNNEDQTGKFKLCYNYEIRVRCCEENTNCLTTPSHTTTTSLPTTTVTPPTTTVHTTTTRPVTTTLPETTTTETTATTASTTTKGTIPVTTTKVVTSPTPHVTTSLPTTTQLPSTTTQQTTTSVGTTCAPICKWSEWFDVDFPTSGPNGGDRETYNNIQAAGGKICKKPVNIQCRAENHPELTTDQVGQIVKCDINFGLVCNNEDQTGKFKLCYNYEIRVRCCEENTNCLTTPSHTTTTSLPTTTVTPPTTTVHTTTTRPVTTTLPETTTTETTATTASTTTKGTIPVTTTKVVTSPTPHVTTSLPTTTQLPSTTTQQTTTSVGTTCAPICKWSEWFDVDFPTSGPNGGDRETYNNIQAAGGKVCSKPVNIQCRAENHPELTTDQVGQIVKCDINFGLVCNNEDQTGKFKLCYNYEIRVRCCEENTNCLTTPSHTTTTSLPTTTVTPPTTTVHTTTTRPVTTTLPETTTTETTATTASTTTKGTIPVTTTKVVTSPTPHVTTSLPTTTQLPSTTTQQTTTSVGTTCAPICKWSEWFDVDFPTSGPNGGDRETYNNIQAAGGKICKKPVNIQCRAENHPELTTDQVGQIVKCDINFGLVCNNEDQTGKFKLCYNYEIRVRCCEENTNCLTTPSHTTTTSLPTTTVTPPTTTVHTTTTRPVTTTLPETTTTETTATTASTTTKGTIPVTTTKVVTSPTPHVTTSLPTTTQLPSTTTQQTTTSVGTTCAPICKWSEWFDVDFPTSGPNGGDRETYNNIQAAGGKICKKPVNIQCRAENHPELTTDQVGQIVKCDINFGLVCNNEDQTGKFKLCYNYEIRVRCCEENTNCLTTPSHTTTTSLPTTTVTPPTTTVHTTTTRPVTTTLPETTTTETTATTASTTTKGTIPVTTTKVVTSPTPHVTTSLPTTTQLPSTTTQQTTTSVGTTCAPICKWSEWFDVDFPTSGPNGGDRETYNNIQAAGGKVCSKPVNIQCRAENHPELTTDQVGQIVKCDINFGLVCNNEDQTGKFKLCYNYEIRVRCCEENTNCLTTPSHTTTTSLPTTTVTPPTTTVHTTTTRPVTTTLPETTTTETTATTASTTTKGTIPVTTTKVVTSPTPHVTTSLPTTTQLPSTTTQQTTTSVGTTCAPICKWSEWFDVDFPTSGPNGGDRETYNNIQAAGGKICKKPVNIQCRAENHPELTTDQVGQIVKCDINFGLVCNNEDQTGKFKLCYNYEIRVRCCEENTNCLTTPSHTTTTSLPTTTVTPPTTTVHTTTTRPVTTTLPETTTTETTATTASTTTKGTIPVTTTKVVTSPTPHVTTSLPTTTQLPSTTTQQTTTSVGTTCAPICKWSEWFDVDFPTSGPNGGDRETYNNIQAAGGKICKKPVNIQCRAENHPELTTDQVGQIVKCDINFGLVCNNEDQTGKFKLCYNYEIRVRCCEENTNCLTTPSHTTTTSLPTTTVTPPTTTVHTTTTRPVTTTLPETTTTETTATTASTTTKGTIPVTTTKVVTSPTPHVTTSLPTTTQLPSTTTQQTTTSVGTTCAPICKWSEWFDVDFPTSGPNGGDRETYKNIQAAGGNICRKPLNIQCRAENHPDLSIDQVGQIVECNVSNGLVCNNREQIGKFKLCFNYAIRVLCCEENVNCLTTPVQTTATHRPTSIVPSTTTSVSTTLPSTTQTIPTSTPPCFCQLGKTIYRPGEIIYNKTDSDGCLFYAICSQTCSVERFQGPCQTTTPLSSTTVTTRTPTTTVPTTIGTTPVSGCPEATPPRKEGETWIENCTKSTCEGNNKVIISQVKCPPVQKIICENGYPPVKVFSEDGCCYHYECECVCSGWGDPHYITFDGTYYTFLDNCTYVLVQQIVPKYGNFRVHIENYFCDSEDGLSCPQSIIIYYQSSKIVLTREVFNGVEANKIYFNGEIVNPGFEKDGIIISMLGINMVAEIPAIEATITFSGLIFSIKLPYSKFGNNTEGQCGTCTNDKRDECRLPDGQITDCPHMAPHWRVHDEKHYCLPQSNISTTPTPPGPCDPTHLCQMITSDVFADCHDVIPPGPFFQGCVFDACHISNVSMQCSGLEIYASLCASKGICIDWRAKTQGACPHSCPVGKVYDPCGPLNPPICEPSKTIQHSGSGITGITEGCFCPKGTKLFNSYSDVCVQYCGCTGPDGLPRAPGTTWTSNCQTCTCDKYSVTVQCMPKPCTIPAPVICHLDGFVPVTVTSECCPYKECRCNTTYCPESVQSCPVGYELKQEKLPGDCCTKSTCVKLPGCVVNGVFYKPGAVIPKGLCEKCSCSTEEDPESKSYTVGCTSRVCDKNCSPGYAYKEKSGQCCGECSPVACVLKQEPNDEHPVIIQPGASWHRTGDNCTNYECEVLDNQFVLVTLKKVCPEHNCSSEDIVMSKDGCCKICKSRSEAPDCKLDTISQVIKHNGCEASSRIQLKYCKGSCNSSSRYSYEANVMDHTCNCCQELKTTTKQVTLTCLDGSTIDYSYIDVEECGCMSGRCASQPTTAPGQQQQEEQEEQEEQQQAQT